MTQLARIAAVVEGHSEVQALPVLVGRIAREKFGEEAVCLRPHRVPRGKMTKQGELQRALRIQASRTHPRGGVVVLLDADEDDPEVLRSRLQVIVAEVSTRTAVVVAVKEFEAWFLAGTESLRVHRSIKDDATYLSDPEGKRDCKRELESLMTESYTEVRHQVAFCAILDLSVTASRSASFQTMIDAVGQLLSADESSIKVP